MHPIRVLLCNHHPIVRSGLRALLEREPEIRVVGEAANGREAVALTEYRHPDVVLLDVQLSHTTGMLAAREISAKAQNVGIVFLSEHADEEYVTEAFKAGARGYVLADSAQNDLIRAIQVVTAGDRFLSPSIALSTPFPE
jgi:DNA-binding NarL/FixJ family response regulator